MSATLQNRLGALALLVLVLPTPPRAATNDDLRLPTPTFAAATAAARDGRPDEALVLLDRALDPSAGGRDDAPLEALVLRASLQAATGQAEAAEANWREVIERQVWMRTFARRALVESLVERGVPAEAEPYLGELSRSDATRHLDLALRVADAYRDQGEGSAARRLYRLILGVERRGPFADSARLGVAALLEADAEIDGALAQLREAKLQHWRADTFEEALTAERRLAPRQGSPPLAFSETQYRTLVRRLRNASRFEPALTLIEEWRANHAPAAGAAHIEGEWISTLYAQRANEAAVAACQAFYSQFPDSSLVPEVRLTDFRLAVRMVDTARARRTGLDLWEGRIRGATPTQRRDAGVLLAAYLVAVGDVAGGLELYRQLFQSADSADDQRAFLWRAGVAALKDGQHERAIANLRGLMSRDPSGDLAPAGLYWLGVAESHTDRETARRTWEAVVRRFPYHYYGMRARERLEPEFGPIEIETVGSPLEFPALRVNPATTERAEYRAAMLLARAGQVEDAAWYLRRLLDRQRRDRGLALLTARASANAGNYASVARILVNHFGAYLQRPATDLPSDFWYLVYPRPFWEAVRTSARAQDVDPLLLFSLMRQESRFDPDARSPVGAIGLFQIMTYTAEALAARAGVDHVVVEGRVDPAALANPATNSAIAARLVADLLDMFDGARAPVAASYNAGEERVAIWWAASRDLSEDLFVDTIPYSETRRFVREVLANLAAYGRIYGDQ